MAKPIHVEVYVQNGNIEKAIKRFEKKVKKSGIIEKFLEKRYYEKPSVAKRLKKIRKKKLSQKQNEKTSKNN